MPTEKAFLAGIAQFTGLTPATGLITFPTPVDHGRIRVILFGIYYQQPLPPAAGTEGSCVLVENPGVNATDEILIRFWSATNLLTNWDYPCKRAIPISAPVGNLPFQLRFVTTTKAVDATLYVDWEWEPIGLWA